jgi:hypothetical protein
MTDALIGHTGFVGSTLQRQRRFDALFHSRNASEMTNGSFDLVVCAAAPAQKWVANRNPEADLANIDGLIAQLSTIRCKTFVLISTVDVFKAPLAVTESDEVDEHGLHAYGLHRRRLEKFVMSHFAQHSVVRLPGLVGPGLRKNVIFDFLNDNNLAAIESRGVFQFYPTINLWSDLQTTMRARLPLVHLTAEPIAVSEVSEQGFGRSFQQELSGTPAVYDMRSLYAGAFGGAGHYQYSRRETIQAVRAYAQSEAAAARGDEVSKT